MTCNTIYFDRLNCQTAEAIAGDTIEITFAGQQIWQGVVNTNGTIELPRNRRYRIPQGEGGEIRINQWYIGQTMENVYAARVRQTDDQGEYIHRVDPNYDSDPNGEYVLSARLTLEDSPPSR